MTYFSISASQKCKDLGVSANANIIHVYSPSNNFELLYGYSRMTTNPLKKGRYSKLGCAECKRRKIKVCADGCKQSFLNQR